MRWSGLPIIGFGLFFSGFAVFWMMGASGLGPWGGNRLNSGMDWFRLVFAAWGLPFFFVGLVPIFMGLAVLAGRSRIEITRDKIRNTEVIGPLYWSWNRPRAQLRRLKVVGAASKTSSQDLSSVVGANAYAISAEFEGTKPLPLAPGYPREMLLAIAHDLARHCRDVSLDAAPSWAGEQSRDVAVGGVGVTGAAGVTVIDSETIEEADDWPRPLSSTIVVDDRRDGITLTLPPTGLVNGTRGMFIFALIWLAIVGAIASLSIKQGHAFANLGAMAFFSVFILVGVLMLVGSIYMARRRAIIDLIDKPATALLIGRSSIFGTKLQDWPAAEIAAVRVGESGTEVNDRPLMQLQIVLVGGKKHGFFTGRDEDELQWLASLLRRELGAGKS